VKFSISEFFWVGKFWQVFFLSIQNRMFLFFVLYYYFNAFWKFLWLEIRHGILWGLNLGQGIFWGFDFCPHSIILHPCHLKSGVPPLPLEIKVKFRQPLLPNQTKGNLDRSES